MPQTSVQYMQPIALEGMLATANPKAVRGCSQELVNRSGVVIPWGRAVVAVTGSVKRVTLPNGTGGKFKGIALLDHWRHGFSYDTIVSANAPVGYLDGSTINVATWGDFWVWVESAVAIADPVYFRHTAAVAPLDQIGRFTNATSVAHDIVPNAKFVTATNAAGLAIVSLFNMV